MDELLAWHRRGIFLLLVLAGGGGCTSAVRPDAGSSADAECACDAQPDSGQRQSRELVVVTLNTHSFQEGSDSLQKLRAIGEGLAALEADLVGLNEVMSGEFWAYDYNGAHYDGTRIIREALEKSSGVKWHAAVFGFARWQDGEEMSNVVLSRTPILRAERRELTTTDLWPAPAMRRNVAYARTEVPGIGPINFFVTHAMGWTSVDTLVQIREVKAYLEEALEGNEGLVLVAGDLNVTPTSAGYASWLAEPTPLIDTYAQANPGGLLHPTMIDGSQRLDYILAAGGYPLADDANRISSYLVFDGRAPRGAVLPTVSDHKGVATAFSYVEP